jgi:hypothetical protein
MEDWRRTDYTQAELLQHHLDHELGAERDRWDGWDIGESPAVIEAEIKEQARWYESEELKDERMGAWVIEYETEFNPWHVYIMCKDLPF